MSLWRLCGDIINAFWTKSLPEVCLVELLHNYHPPFVALKKKEERTPNAPAFWLSLSFWADHFLVERSQRGENVIYRR